MESIPEIEFTIEKTQLNFIIGIVECYICGTRMSRSLMASRLRFGWQQKVPYKIWRQCMKLLGKPTGLHFHSECLPLGWKFWTIEFLPDLITYHSFDCEVELIDQIQ